MYINVDDCIVCTLPADDSEKSKGWQPRFLKNYVICGISLHRYAQVAVFVTVVGYLLALTVYYFSIEVDVEMWTITSQIRMCICYNAIIYVHTIHIMCTYFSVHVYT